MVHLCCSWPLLGWLEKLGAGIIWGLAPLTMDACCPRGLSWTVSQNTFMVPPHIAWASSNCSQGECPKGESCGSCIVLYGLTSEVMQHHFHCILFIRGELPRECIQTLPLNGRSIKELADMLINRYSPWHGLWFIHLIGRRWAPYLSPPLDFFLGIQEEG